jgi:hypothetical protein
MKKLCLALLLVGLTTAAIAAPPVPVPNPVPNPGQPGLQSLQKPGGFHKTMPVNELNQKRNQKLFRVKMINNKRLS